MQLVRPGCFLIISAVLLLTGCDSPSELGSAEAQGRTRLSANKSYAEFGEYTVHINAMSTAALTPEIAQGYGITRSETTGLINLVVLRESAELGQPMPVNASVKVSAANLTAQSKAIEIREIVDGPSIYYIGTVSIDNEETINFDTDIVPEGSNRNLQVRYTNKFYTP